jgi:hypothetical protein
MPLRYLCRTLCLCPIQFVLLQGPSCLLHRKVYASGHCPVEVKVSRFLPSSVVFHHSAGLLVSTGPLQGSGKAWPPLEGAKRGCGVDVHLGHRVSCPKHCDSDSCLQLRHCFLRACWPMPAVMTRLRLGVCCRSATLTLPGVTPAGVWLRWLSRQALPAVLAWLETATA